MIEIERELNLYLNYNFISVVLKEGYLVSNVLNQFGKIIVKDEEILRIIVLLKKDDNSLSICDFNGKRLKDVCKESK